MDMAIFTGGRNREWKVEQMSTQYMPLRLSLNHSFWPQDTHPGLLLAILCRIDTSRKAPHPRPDGETQSRMLGGRDTPEAVADGGCDWSSTGLQ